MNTKIGQKYKSKVMSIFSFPFFSAFPHHRHHFWHCSHPYYQPSSSAPSSFVFGSSRSPVSACVCDQCVYQTHLGRYSSSSSVSKPWVASTIPCITSPRQDDFGLRRNQATDRSPPTPLAAFSDQTFSILYDKIAHKYVRQLLLSE